MRISVSLAALSIALLASAPARAAGNLAPLPAASAAPAATGAPAGGDTSDPTAPPATPAAPSPLERVRRGVVLIERDGRLLGFGTVLAGDGRILTSLSAVNGETADVQYADGVIVHAKLGHRDAAWDLALLVPHTVHWKDGLTASEVDPAAADLRAPVPARAGAKPIALPVHFKGRTDALSRAGDSLLDALDVEVHHALPIAGAPILDAQATVVGVLVRACKLAVASPPAWSQETAKGGPAGQPSPLACAPTLIGAPIAAVRGFLMRTPADATPPTPRLGIVGEHDESGTVHGVRVMKIAPQSPAQKAGLKASTDGAADVIVAVDGAPVDTPEKLADAIAKHAVGDTVKLLVLGGHAETEGPDAKASIAFRDVNVVLKAAP